MYALCLQGELKKKTWMLHNTSQAGQMNMCPSRQWGASIPPIFSMGGFSPVDLLQLDLPKHPNHVWKVHRLGMIRLSAAVKLWSCRHALGLQSTGAPPAAGRRLVSGAPRRVSANVHIPPPAGRGSNACKCVRTALHRVIIQHNQWGLSLWPADNWIHETPGDVNYPIRPAKRNLTETSFANKRTVITMIILWSAILGPTYWLQ